METHRFGIWLSSRQIGKSFSVALWAVLRAIENPRRKVICLSSSESQSKELMEKAQMHNEFMGKIEAHLSEKEVFFEDKKFSQLDLNFTNGSRVIGLPSNPRTARGYSGDIVLDEFAFHVDNKKIWQSMFPSITRGYQVLITSTPQGKNDKFYHLWTEAQKDSRWYSQQTDIYQAVKDGLSQDPEILHSGIKDEDIWQTEYLCQFMDSVEAFLTYELIENCEMPNILLEDLRGCHGDLYLGGDIGRKKDLTTLKILERIEDVLYLRKIIILKNTPFSTQRDIINQILSFCRRSAIDATGLGMQLAEELVKIWGEYKVLPITFTAQKKLELASKLKNRFTDKTIRIPIDTDLREDLHSVRKMVSDSGNILLSAERTDLGHADRFWGLALANYAASVESPQVAAPPVFGTQSTGGLEYGYQRLV